MKKENKKWISFVEALEALSKDVESATLSPETLKSLNVAFKDLTIMLSPETIDKHLDFDYKLLKSVDPRVLGLFVTTGFAFICDQHDIHGEVD